MSFPVSSQFKKGHAKTGGRKKGASNVLTRELKDMILHALDGAGGVKYLEDQAHKNPGPFLSLVGKVLPMTVKAEGSGFIVEIHSKIIRETVPE